MTTADNSIGEKFKKSLSSDKWTAKSITAMVLFGAIVMVFVFFGLPGKMGMGVGSAGHVNGAILSLADLQNEEQRVQQYYAQMFGGQMDFSNQRNLLRQQALENLVQMEVAAQATKTEGLLITDAEVRNFIIKDMPFLQKDGVFQREYYIRYLEMSRMSPAAFEDKVRKMMGSTKARDLFELSSTPLKLEIEKQNVLKNTKLNLAFVKIDADLMAKTMKVSQAEVLSKLSNDEFSKKTKEYFEQNKVKFEQSEEVHAQHILIMAKAGDKKAEEAASKKIQDLSEKSKKEDFGKLAGQFSEDPGSKTKKGDLGFFGRGKMVKEFEDVAFSLKAGQVSAPVKTPYGYHLIKVLDKKEAKAADFEKMKNEVAGELIAKEKLEVASKKIEEGLSSGQEDQVNAGLKEISASWEETGFFDLSSENVPKISAQNAIDSLAEISQGKPLLNKFLREGSTKYIIKLKSVKNEVTKEETKQNSPETLTKIRANEGFEAWVQNFKKQSKVEINPMVLEK